MSVRRIETGGKQSSRQLGFAPTIAAAKLVDSSQRPPESVPKYKVYGASNRIESTLSTLAATRRRNSGSISRSSGRQRMAPKSLSLTRVAATSRHPKPRSVSKSKKTRTFKRTSNVGSRNLFVAAAVSALFAIVAILVVRQTPLVKVDKVTLSGQIAPDLQPLVSEIQAAAIGKPTIFFPKKQLAQAVPGSLRGTVSLTTSVTFPHKVSVEVIDRRPVGRVVEGGKTIFVDRYGQSATASANSASLPLLSGAKLAEMSAPETQSQLAIASTIPARAGDEIESIRRGSVVKLKSGQVLRFRNANDASLKWKAASAVLSSQSGAVATWIDLSEPELPTSGRSRVG